MWLWSFCSRFNLRVKKKNYALNPSVHDINHQWSDKLWVPDAQSVGGRPGEVTVRPLWTVWAWTRVVRGITGPLRPALHGEGRLALAVNVRIDAAVHCRSGGLGQVVRWRSDFPPWWEAVAGTGGFVGNLATQQTGESVAAEKEQMNNLLRALHISHFVFTELFSFTKKIPQSWWEEPAKEPVSS